MPSFHLPHPDDVQKEIELHLELRAKEFEAQGMSAEQAHKAALAAFGDRGAIESEVQSLRGDTLRERHRRDRVGELLQDLKVAVRGLLRASGFTAVALLTLALGIGANSAIFSVVRSVLLRPLPYPDSQQLVQLWTDHRARGRAEPEWLTPTEFFEWRDGNSTFSGMAAYTSWGPDLTGSGEPEALGGIMVSGNYFMVLGATPALGRLLSPADDDARAEGVIVLSDALWRRRFGAERGVLGRVLQLNGESWTIVGVLPRQFRPPLAVTPEVYRALRRPADSRCRWGCFVWRAVGRMKPGVTFAQAEADLKSIARRLEGEQPATNAGVGAWPIPLHEQITGPTRTPLFALAGAVLFVLLIGCVNLANLLLVRGAGRARELGVRAALGAGRGRLVRQLLTESALLAVAGGALGLLLSLVGGRVLGSLVPAGVRGIQEIRVDGVVVAVTAALSVVSGLLFGLLPALHVARSDLMGVLRNAGRDVSGRSGLRNGLVVAELAIAVVLLVGAGLLLRSFLLMQQVDLGYRSRGVVLASIGLPRARYADAARMRLATEELLARLRANPALRAAEVTDLPPLSQGDQDITAIPLGQPKVPGRPEGIWYRAVSPGYLQAMRIRVIAGRQLGPDDREGSPPVGVLNETAARVFWPGQDPVGQVLATAEDSTGLRITIVGVVGATRQDGPNQPLKPEIFVPIDQDPQRGLTFVLEPKRDAETAVAAFRQALREVDPLVPVATEPIEQRVAMALSLPKLYALLIGGFAVAALLLAALGVYGVMAYAVSLRRREIGVRLALGAAPGGIQRLVLGQGGKLALAGLGLGLLAALAVTRLLTRLLFGVGAFDVVTYTVVPLVLGAMALLACWLPARRAMRVDPLVAMREE
ncbi:MAG TPA: ABC transporter permease [Gemmatimonadales bacterium]|jgi:putative ABC transport system permease protein|nr:ABC transporter permease [Gemmatimonadales bacterium]